MSIEDQELLNEFVIESQEHLSDVENQLLTLESQGDAMDVALVNTVFRAVHSIKGAAGFLGLDVLQALAHREEEILNKLRNHELRPTSLVIDTLLKATDRLKTLLDEIDSSNDQDVSDHIAALERILSGDADDHPPAPSSSETAHPAPVIVEALSDETLKDFLVESYDNLSQLERDLLALEAHPDSPDSINSVFRNIHTIKGTAGFLGFGKLERLTHVAENLLGDVRSGKLKLCKNITGALLQTIDKVRELLQSIETTGAESDCGSDNLADALATLNEVLLPFDAPPPATSKKKPAGRAKALTSVSSVPDEIKAKPKAKAKEPKAQAKKATGPVPSTSPTLATATTATTATTPVIAAASTKPATSTVAESQEASTSSVTKSSSPPDASLADSTIRVDVSLLDKLMTCVGELVLARNQILQFANGNVENELHRTSQRLNSITSELQESVMKTRMQPIGNVWAKFPRLVRDLAGICEKEVRIEMEGKETELDKTIIEAIKDPLTHLVRNTVDHGIERPEVREQVGKNREGCLTLKAYHEGGQVNIEICDDGAGINSERVKAKALEKGLMTQEQLARMSDRDVGNLIFLPGFSTAEKVSNVSGRGVGMDVVKTNIEKIGGTVDLQSQQGTGTVIKIKIPLTLAIIPALIVTCDNNRYAIPQVNLLELLRLDGDQVESQIEWIQSAPVYRLRGRLLPLVYLRDQLRAADVTKPESLNIVVLRADGRQFGLIVDRINDSEEIVVKPLSSQLKSIPVYSGTTIMGDGKVALILDVMGLAQTANVIADASKSQTTEYQSRSHASSAGQHSLLVAGVGHSQRIAVELAQVTRLEKIEAHRVETADNREVVQYRGEILSLIRLSDVMGVGSSRDPDDPLLDVIVYSESERTVGIVVDRIIDIVDQTIEITKSAHTHGRSASAVIQGHVTDLIDLPAIMSQYL
jgi:two-component system, chemotaxis family, sensor kinase CheA